MRSRKIGLLAASLIAPVLFASGAAARDNAREVATAAPAVETGESDVSEVAAAFRATSPPNADPARAYEGLDEALIAGDLDYLAHEAHRALARGDEEHHWRVLAFVDALAANRFDEARQLLVDAPEGINGGLADVMEPFLLAAEGRADRGVERVEYSTDQFPAPLPDVARALVFESAGRLLEASAIYAQVEQGLDLTPPAEGEPASLEEFQRSMNAGRTTHAMYRSALVQHRLGNVAEARRLYGVVSAFAPNSADVQSNLARLENGDPPLEPALDSARATGRWLLFLSEYLTQGEMLRRALTGADPEPGLASSSGMMFLQMGVALEPNADDWRLYAATSLVQAGGLDGAERIVDMIPETSVFAPDADIVRAQIAIERSDDASAAAAAERALAQAGDRWSVVASAGDIYRSIGRSAEAITAFNRALDLTEESKDRARLFGWRAYAHRYAGDQPAATADARAALALDQGVNTRLLFVSILMDDARAWSDGIRVARELFAEQPDSVMRLNALGYALIQRPEGLEEGYRLLWRGFSFSQSDYAVIDSLGWAYYLHGAYDEARALIERANDLSASEPNSEVLDHLGDVYWRLNRRDDARQAWREGLDARPDALRRRSLERKLARGLTEAAPRRRDLPNVSLPTGPAERGDL